VDLFRPRIGALRLLEELGHTGDSRVNLHEWHLSIRAPDTRQDAGPGAPPGRQTRPPRGGGGGGGGFPICTIEGTARGERLTGTSGNDIICAYGGDDHINGRGGHDLVYAGPGNDRASGGRGLDTLYGNDGRDNLATRDGKQDKAHGGAGTDAASVDGRDRTVSVERVSRR
jgi:Ca2+-binding RTX toxin-like protein